MGRKIWKAYALSIIGGEVHQEGKKEIEASI